MIFLSTKRLTYIALCASLIAALTFFCVPTPWGVPITGQTLAVLVTGLLLSPVDAFFAVLLYITMGIIGLPVFSGAKSGIGVLLGPTGGYIYSFLIGVYILSLFAQKNKPIRGSLVFTAIVYLVGSFQLAITTNSTFLHALKIGMLPFLPGDFLKIYLSFVIAKRLVPLFKTQNQKA